MALGPAVVVAMVAGASAGASAPAPGFLKGQLHLHSSRSGDSRTPPADVVRWYAARGYDFIVMTDHQRVTVMPSPAPGGMLVIPGVEITQNLARCRPAPPPGLRCLLHVNALFVTPPAGGGDASAPPITLAAAPAGDARLDIFRRALVTTRRLGGIAQLNHPNFHYAADAALIIALGKEGMALLEIANQAWDSNNAPDDPRRPSTEALWDAALSAGADVYGTATDDAHHYDDAAATGARGEPVFTGDLGFVMVRARKDAAAIRAALAAGDFYSSTGVLLDRVERSPGALVIEVAAASPGPHVIRFVGSRGKLLGETRGSRASFDLGAARAGGYVRAVVSGADGARAWVQPVRVR
jgi:hypothetical protein